MRILKKIFRLFQGKVPDENTPPEFPASEGASSKNEPVPGFNPNEADNIFEELLNDVGFLISRLNYVGRNAREQEEKRMEAMQRLQALGPEAEEAVFALVPKLFGEKAQERQLALQTLESIDAGWQQHEQVVGQIPFMLEKLNKGYPIGSKAIDILSAIGTPAVPFLLDALKPDSGRDDFFRSNALRCLNKMEPPAEVLPAIIETTLKQSSSAQMLEAAADAICAHSDWATPNMPFLLPLLEKEDPKELADNNFLVCTASFRRCRRCSLVTEPRLCSLVAPRQRRKHPRSNRELIISQFLSSGARL